MRSLVGKGKRTRWRGFVTAYVVTCLPTGKQYVGICVSTMRERWLTHCRDARIGKSQTKLHRAIRKYGPTAFSVTETAYSTTWADACEVERALISQYGTYPGGLNMTTGGDGTWGVIQSLETREKRSKAMTGKKHVIANPEAYHEARKASWTPERRAKYSADAKARMADPAYKQRLMDSHGTPEYRAMIADRSRGRRASQETRARMSRDRKGRVMSAESSEKKRIAMLARNASKKEAALKGAC